MLSKLLQQAAGNAGAEAVYVEDVFSTYLYTGNGSTQTITNGIDLAGEGGLVWLKGRSGATDHALYDTARGATKDLVSNSVDAETTQSTGLTAFNSNGFSIGSLAKLNTSSATYASWTFRKQPKFFDVVTYTGNGSNRTISHNLGSVPGCVIVKRTDYLSDWSVYHRSLTSAAYVVYLNGINAESSVPTAWNSTAPTSSVFSLGTDSSVNASGGTYVAYLFAHGAGGFGAGGSEDVISCGSYAGDSSSNNVVTLGYEPQWLMIKKISSNSISGFTWLMFDNMRGVATGGNDAFLDAASSNSENSANELISFTATGFSLNSASSIINSSGETYIYIAIRRGPMKTPTSGTEVFSANAVNVTTGTQITTGFPIDLQIFSLRTGTTNKNNVYDRLRGVSSNTTESGVRLITSSTAAETAAGNETLGWGNTGFKMTSVFSSTSDIFWNFRRAPGFFDVVCYTGTGVARTVNHNLGAVPELMIVKKRSAADAWVVYANNDNTDYLVLNTTAATVDDNTIWNDTSPTSSVFTVGTNDDVNGNTATFVAYLFATVAGVSKVGSYTGSGTTKQIDCGFTGGARFVLIKRTDSTGDWYVWDTARGIVAGNDPYLLLNSTAAEVTSTDYVDTYSAGFELSSTAPAAINASGGSFIYLAIA